MKAEGEFLHLAVKGLQKVGDIAQQIAEQVSPGLNRQDCIFLSGLGDSPSDSFRTGAINEVGGETVEVR